MFFSDKKQANKSRDLDESEHSLSYLLTVKKSEVNNPVLYRKYKTEALKRLTKPLYNLSFMLLAMFAILSPFYNRRGQMGRINFIVLATIIVQSLSLAFENLTAKNLWFSPLMFLNIFVPVIIIYFITMKQLNPKILKIPHKFLVLFCLASLLTIPSVSSAQVKFDPQVKVEKDKTDKFKKKSTSITIEEIISKEYNQKYFEECKYI